MAGFGRVVGLRYCLVWHPVVTIYIVLTTEYESSLNVSV